MAWSPGGDRYAVTQGPVVRVRRAATGELVLRTRGATSFVDLWFEGEQTLAGLDSRGAVWRWSAGGASELDGTALGELTNARVCRDEMSVVAVVPYPPPETVWAPAASCP